MMDCSKFENEIYKIGRGNLNGFCVYEEKVLDVNTHKIVYITPHVFSKEKPEAGMPIRLHAAILHKNTKGYFTYTYEEEFYGPYLSNRGDAFIQIKDIFEKRIPQTMKEVVDNMDILKDMEI